MSILSLCSVDKQPVMFCSLSLTCKLFSYVSTATGTGDLLIDVHCWLTEWTSAECTCTSS